MAIVYKCKCCAGSLEVEEGMRLVKCPACRTKQTLPSSRDENIQNLFNRATTQRLKCEFDKAESVYERIIQADEEQYEAYWGLILCKFGVEYVEDPKTETRIPTCHRTSFESIVADENYKLALKYALDDEQKELYKQEAQEIDKIQKGILEVAQNEEPYDVFICYKETDENGKRTQDSVIANDIYHQLTQEGFKVFYAAITLEGKLGSAYEPIIFAALNSAKVMLAVGTKPEYFQAIWVKNEWSRFLKMNKDNRNKLLIPCYKGMDAYDLPDEFAHLQAQDMSKIGFITDLIRGIKKVMEKSAENPVAVVVNAPVNTQIENLIKRANLALEDGEFDKARSFAEQALNIDAEYAQAYVVELLCDFNAKSLRKLGNKCILPQLEENANYKKALRFANGDLKTKLDNVSKDLLLREIKALPFIEKRDLESVKKKLEALNGFKPAEEYLANLDEMRNQQLIKIAREKKKQRIGFITFASIIVFIIAIISVWSGISNFNKRADLQARGGCALELSSNGEYYVVNGLEDKSVQDLIIPSEYKNKPIKYIDDEAFSNCDRLTSVAIPDSVTNIGASAFYDCDNLTSVVIPDSVTDIGNYTFRHCDRLTNIVFPNNLTTIGECAFYGCYGLTSVVFPNNLTTIGDCAFYGCYSLTSVVIPDSITRIGDSAFCYCNSLTEMTLPFIGEEKEGTNNTHFGYIFGASASVYNGDYVPTSLKKVTITCATSIESNAFYECGNLTEVIISNNVTTIGKQAFYECSGLMEIIIPNSVTIINEYAFYGCASLTIYCEAKSKPSGWKSYWNYSAKLVVWDYTGE